MMLHSSPLALLLLFWSCLSPFKVVQAQNMDCNDYNKGKVLDVGQFKTFIADMGSLENKLVSAKMNYHIYYMPPGTTPRWQSASDNVEPRRNGDSLQFHYTKSLYNNGVGQKYGIGLWVPNNWMSTIKTSTDGNTIKVQNTEQNGALQSITLTDTGTGNNWRVDSHVSPIQFTSSGALTYIKSKVHSGSSYYLAAKNEAEINLIYGSDLRLTMGDFVQVKVRGQYTQMDFRGKNSEVEIFEDNCGNNCKGCNQVYGRGTNGNTCELTSYQFGQVDPPACAAPVIELRAGGTRRLRSASKLTIQV